MSGLRTKDYLLNGTAVACTASATAVVSNVIPISEADARAICIRIVLSAITTSNGFTFKLQDSPYDGQWDDVTGYGSRSAQVASVKKSLTAGTAKVETVTLPTSAAATQADYIQMFNQAGTSFAFWLDKNAAGTAPTGTLYVASTNKVKVSIVTGGTAAQNGTIFAAAATTAFGATATVVDNGDGTVTVTQASGGTSAASVPKSANDGAAGSITDSIGTAGSAGNVVVSTGVFTISTHGFTNGQRVIYAKASGGQIGGLVDGTSYYVIVVTANTFKLAATSVLAHVGTALTLTDSGTGTQALYAADLEISLIDSDANDVGCLPLMPNARIAAVSGTSDTCTVANVFVTKRHG